MARVPQAQDIGVSSFNVGSAAQIDIGVAKEIGRAGSAIGDAVAALGGAFGELAGRVQAAESAQAASGLQQDFLDNDARIENDAITTDAPDGSNWRTAGTRLGEYSKEWENDPRWGMLSPRQKEGLKVWHRGVMRDRAVGPGSYPNKERAAQFTYQSGKLGEAANGSLVRLDPAAPRNTGIAPQVYDSRLETEKAFIYGKIDEMTGPVYTPAQAQALKDQYGEKFFQAKYQWLQQNGGPEAAQQFFDEYKKLRREGPTAAPGPQSSARPTTAGEYLKSRLAKGYEKRTSDVEDLHPVMQDRLGAFMAAAEEAGHDIRIVSGNRSVARQKVLWDNAVKKYGSAEAARKWVAPPGGSSHQSGEAVDLQFGDRAAGLGGKRTASVEWAHANAKKFGLHFPLGHEDWHIEPVEARAGGKRFGGQYAQGEPMWKAPAGALGPDDAKRVAAAQAGGFKANLTAYSPQAKGSKMEGGYAAARKGPDGKAEVRTLDDVLAGRSDYVTLAGNPKQYGKEYIIPSITYVDKSGKEHTLKNVRAVVHDTGSAFKKAGEDRFDVAIARDVSNKTMAANHSRWKQEGVQFVEAGAGGQQEAPPVSERGLVQVAGLKPPQEGVQVADAEGRIPQSASMESGSVAALEALASVVQQNPEAKLGAVATAEQLEKVRSILGEDVDVSQVTVGELQEVLGKVAPAAEEAASDGFKPDMGGGAGGDAVQPQAPEEDYQAGPVLPGQEMVVRTATGFMKFTSDELRHLTPRLVREMEKDYKARRSIAVQQNKALADEMMKAQINSWEQENKPVDPKFINQKVIDAAYPPGTPKRVAFDKKITGLETISKVFSNSGDKSIQELGYEVESLAPKQSKSGTAEEYNVGVETYEKARAKLAATVKLRTEDPALSVESSELVQAVRSKFENGIPKRENEKRMLIDARMLAQRQIGIPENQRSPITDGEAAYFSSQLDDVPPEEISTRIESVAAAIKQNYGKDYTGVVLKSVISNYVKRNQDKEEMINAAQTLASKREIGPLELERAKEAVDMRVRNVLNWRANQADHYAKLSKSSAFRAKVQEAARLNGLSGASSLTEGLIGKGGGSNLTQGLMGRTKPPQEAIDSLRTGKITQQQFERLYGLTPAQSAQYLLRGKP